MQGNAVRSFWPALVSNAPPGRVFLVALAAAVGAAAWATEPSSAVRPLVAILGAVAVTVATHDRARRGRGAGKPPQPEGNLLARQLRISALEAEAKRFQRFAREAPIGIVFIGQDGKMQFANDEYLRIVGSTPAELEADRYRAEVCVPPGWLDPRLGVRHEAEWVRPDGSKVPVLVALSAQEDGLAAFIVDLTAEKAAERAREESEERYRAIAEKLAESDRRKDEFLAVLSHELRNPLAPIRNAVHLLRSEPAGDGARHERILAIVERQVNHLGRLVDDLLDVTRITRGRVELRRERVDLTELLRRTAEDHRALALARGLELVVSVPPAAVWVDGDPTRLVQIAGNLLQNAVKFSERGGRVTLELAASEGWAEIRVADTGIGIEPSLLEHVFEPFVQAERTLARSTGGLGLGLALVKALAEMHGGSVRASSAGRGCGAELVVRIPQAGEDA
ncbi:PAS domain-containing sensor histidine kinase [Anaeromyxobacter oryzae]|uniref:histidine kinase n=1 Tax=Anaeromyxobacter oryzae TaxID=2918170 RepID=A0ABM7X0A1_9BACT|nr:PAS domain-containing sensor histidine kinase [Anaeromyxobacter oryzae]BDG05211.1 hypothetical protein AMOR_42070 [Anaeromyxobacter oryzae]